MCTLHKPNFPRKVANEILSAGKKNYKICAGTFFAYTVFLSEQHGMSLEVSDIRHNFLSLPLKDRLVVSKTKDEPSRMRHTTQNIPALYQKKIEGKVKKNYLDNRKKIYREKQK